MAVDGYGGQGLQVRRQILDQVDQTLAAISTGEEVPGAEACLAARIAVERGA